jgi:sugar lactone lactonase YvrE
MIQDKMSNRNAWGVAVVAALLGAGCSSLALRPGTLPATAVTAPQAVPPAEGSGPFLYVGGFKLSMYALGSTKPLHVAKVNPQSVLRAAIALDLHGHLCEANGEVSEAQLLEYDADTLKFVKGLTGVGAYPAIVADRLGYLYASTDSTGIVVYAPGCTHEVHVIRHAAGNVGQLIFDRSGDLYVGLQSSAVSVYAPTKRPGHMRLIRRIRDGLSDPGALAIGPSGKLFVGNYTKEGGGYITVYPPDGSKPVLRITKGLEVPGALAVDSKGRLYVAVPNYAMHSGGWISVYPPGGSQPVRKVHIPNPVALALDPSDNLYIANQARDNSVLVYGAGATKLLYTIKLGNNQPSALLIGSP